MHNNINLGAMLTLIKPVLGKSPSLRALHQIISELS